MDSSNNYNWGLVLPIIDNINSEEVSEISEAKLDIQHNILFCSVHSSLRTQVVGPNRVHPTALLRGPDHHRRPARGLPVPVYPRHAGRGRRPGYPGRDDGRPCRRVRFYVLSNSELLIERFFLISTVS